MVLKLKNYTLLMLMISRIPVLLDNDANFEIKCPRIQIILLSSFCVEYYEKSIVPICGSTKTSCVTSTPFREKHHIRNEILLEELQFISGGCTIWNQVD